MPSPARRLPANAPGDFYVDDTCIDCGACRWVAPESFDAHGNYSRVYRQPETETQRRAALHALVRCPSASIGNADRAAAAAAIRDFPRPFAPDVLHCGFHSTDSYGAASWLILRPDGNVLVDSPRYNAPLAQAIEALGGVRWMFLTHRDDVADHAKFRERFGCERVMHRADGGRMGELERWVDGEDPVALAPDLLVIPTPGHTRGSACLLFRDEVLFTGDTLAWSAGRGHVYAFRDACWYSWEHLRRSVDRLSAWRFSWLLPGHGAPVHLPEPEMSASLRRCVDWMASPR
jgi:glyoxylase-like metal-dependent hydrolase (beta-lactamase superfamily II)/ferredoxin